MGVNWHGFVVQFPIDMQELLIYAMFLAIKVIHTLIKN